MGDSAGRMIVVLAIVLVAGCSHRGRSGAGFSATNTICLAPESTPRNDTTEKVIVVPSDDAALVASLEHRLRLMGADCPEATLTPAVTTNGLPVRPGASTLHLRWLKAVGDDPTKANTRASFLLRPGELSLRTVTVESAGPCTSTRALVGSSPADVAVAGQCLHLSSPFIEHLIPTKAAVTPTTDPFMWTLTLTLDRPTVRRVANAPTPLFASIDGFPLGRAALAGDVLSATGHYDGGGTEASADACNAQVSIPSVLGYDVTS